MTELEDRTIIVVGRTGAGKSELVTRAIKDGGGAEGQKTPQVSAGLRSCTMHSETYPVPGLIDNARYHLVDTKGWMDVSDNDKGALEQLADLIQTIHNLVGVVYVLPGRMESNDVELLDFLFTFFFDHVPPSKLLVVKSKCSFWEGFNVAAEKEQLRGEGKVPSIMLEAKWQAVDFHPYAPAETISQMVGNFREQFATWTDPLPVQAAYGGYVKKIQTAHLALTGYKSENTRLNTLLDRASERSEEHQQEIRRLREKYHEDAMRVEDILSRVNREHNEVVARMELEHKSDLREMMEQMKGEMQSKKGIFCSIM
ncbi:hypothetical protein BSKO_13423 [Bryopsis sp. KO-2023]|nr:hypothetical protein BSKO_13423 [Bryopsis sp. KO-2023]